MIYHTRFFLSSTKYTWGKRIKISWTRAALPTGGGGDEILFCRWRKIIPVLHIKSPKLFYTPAVVNAFKVHVTDKWSETALDRYRYPCGNIVSFISIEKCYWPFEGPMICCPLILNIAIRCLVESPIWETDLIVWLDQYKPSGQKSG